MKLRFKETQNAVYKLLVISISLLVTLSACGSPDSPTTPSNPAASTSATDNSTADIADTSVAQPSETTPPTTADKRENGIYGDTIVLGYISFMIPDGFFASVIDENTFMLSSITGDCSFGLFAADISELDEARAKLYLPLQAQLFFADGILIDDIDIIDGYIAGYDVDVEFYGVSDGNEITFAMDSTFTDSWYAYTIIFRSDGGDSLSDNVGKFVAFTGHSRHEGPDSRFGFVQ